MTTPATTVYKPGQLLRVTQQQPVWTPATMYITWLGVGDMLLLLAIEKNTQRHSPDYTVTLLTSTGEIAIVEWWTYTPTGCEPVETP